MTSRGTPLSNRPDRRITRAQFEELADRIERTERQLAVTERRLDQTTHKLEQLQNTVRGIARETDVSISGPCNRCARSHLLIKDGLLYCPQCGCRHSM